MRIPKLIESYYTRKLFELIQLELVKIGIKIETYEQLGGVAVFQRIGHVMTMFIKEDKVCTYSDLYFNDGFVFNFNNEPVNVEVPGYLIHLVPILNIWDSIKDWCFDKWIDLKIKWKK